MSQLNTIPVFKCRHCGNDLVEIHHLSTDGPDPEGKLLHQLMKNLHKIALCPDCKRKYDYYARQGRSEDFERGLP